MPAIVEQASTSRALRAINRRLRGVEQSDGSSEWVPVDTGSGNPLSPGYVNGWGDAGDENSPLMFKRFLNWVHFRGAFVGGENGTVVFTLPELFRPPYQQQMILPLNDGTGYASVLIGIDGTVTYIGLCSCSGGGGGAVDSVGSEDGTVGVTDGSGPDVDLSIAGLAVLSVDAGDGPLTDAVVLAEGDNITLSTSGNTITIASSGGGGGIAEITSDDGSLEVTDGTGPDTDLSVADSPAWGGVTITGTPTSGQVPIASDGTDAAWGDVGAAELPDWLQSGDGSPLVDALDVTPAQIGAVYFDLLNGAMYEAAGTTSDEWVALGGVADKTAYGGVYSDGAGGTTYVWGMDTVALTDVFALAGSQDGIYWAIDDGDGSQVAYVQTGDLGSTQSATLLDKFGDSSFPGTVTENGLRTTKILTGALPVVAVISGVAFQVLVAGTIVADDPPSLPLTVSLGTSDGFVMDSDFGEYAFFLAPGTYATVDDLVAAMNAAPNSDGTDPFNSMFFATNVAGSIVINEYFAGSEGATINYGPPFVTATNPATAPLTVTTGVNDEFFYDDTGQTYTVAPGTYATADDVAAAMNAALDSFSDAFLGFVRVVNVGGTLIANGNGSSFGTLESGANDFLADSGFTNGQVIGDDGDDTAISGLGFADGQVMTGENSRDFFLAIPVTFNPTGIAAATCTVELSPSDDGSTFTTVISESVPADAALDGTVRTVALQVPYDFYVRVTVVNADIGTAVFY